MKSFLSSVLSVVVAATIVLSGNYLLHSKLLPSKLTHHNNQQQQNSTDSVTFQTTTGTATGKFDCVEFTLTTEPHGTTGPASKEKAQLLISNNIQPALDTLKEKKIIFDETKSTFSTNQYFVYNNGEHHANGYVTNYTMILTTKLVDRATEIQDVLASIEGVNLYAPNFSLSNENKQRLQNAAVEDAFKVAQFRFKNECQTLGLEPANFKINTWNVNYEAFNRRFYGARAQSESALGGAGDLAAIKVDSGSATVQVTLTVNYKETD